jgi:hypothetical protein
MTTKPETRFECAERRAFESSGLPLDNDPKAEPHEEHAGYPFNGAPDCRPA